MMPVVILAGGFGLRLRPLTDQLPKPLLRVRGKPFLHHQVDLLKAFGMTEILLLVGYLGWKIKGYFGDGSGLGVHIDYAVEETPLGTGGALKKAAEKLPPDFLLLNGDTFLALDYPQFVESYRKRDRWGLVVAFENPHQTMPNNLAVGPEGCITAYNKENRTGLTHVDAGVAVFSKRILELIPPGRVCSLEEEVYPRLIEREKLWAFPTRQPFYDMGSFAGLEALVGALR